MCCCFKMKVNPLLMFSKRNKAGLFVLFNFLFGDKSPFCGITGVLFIRLWLTLPMGFKDTLLLLVHYDPQIELWPGWGTNQQPVAC